MTATTTSFSEWASDDGAVKIHVAHIAGGTIHALWVTVPVLGQRMLRRVEGVGWSDTTDDGLEAVLATPSLDGRTLTVAHTWIRPGADELAGVAVWDAKAL